ncbi:hypothetical protein M5X11_08340 [Paenibacillus alginolyticus]|uniref:Uncharacterized protein n=1 Tax=Paenibacillus alginolyticus TaxID=59839 RepID=A0ABT4GIX3_9BACL|nr:hypothetical protein [Paenibacillus alginolyticus]MCY9664963.1 hypothetical protein [Paenibacillus alginolyticus]MCY9696066.1 hypothetical protein [Paenibacillus alginolyticus]MEC0147486.1 hypothetical protein [Paenibacillus alginolyticus]
MKVKMALLSITLLLSLPLSANAARNINVVTSPATETTVNGIPESQLMTTQDVTIGPYFDSYTPNSNSTVLKFKKIASYSHDNSRNSTEFPMEVSITYSTSQGSEWSGSISFTGEIKAGIFAKLGATIGGGYKDARSTNEAVGIKGGPLKVPAYKWGYIDMWYKGQATGGLLRTYTQNTADLSVKYYKDTLINATVFKSDYVDVHSEAWTN